MLRAYAGLSGYDTTPDEEQSLKSDDCDPTYGELVFAGVTDMVKILGIRPSDHFVDIGSGVGKLVLQVAMQTGAHCTGVELCRSRFDQAVQAMNYCQTYNYTPHVRFVHANATLLKYETATIVYMCSTCFNPNMILRVVERLSPGCRVVLQTPPDAFESDDADEQRPQFSRVLEYSDSFEIPVTWAPKVPLYVYSVQLADQ
jgi:2-polyprenyl-3-methyl-5-hydroxy-6-metoxy-1,4-benzoquinol methylase